MFSKIKWLDFQGCMTMVFVVRFCSGNIPKRKAGFQAALRSIWAAFWQHLGSTGKDWGTQGLGNIEKYLGRFRQHLGRVGNPLNCKTGGVSTWHPLVDFLHSWTFSYYKFFSDVTQKRNLVDISSTTHTKTKTHTEKTHIPRRFSQGSRIREST